jgi:hypothetical protein
MLISFLALATLVAQQPADPAKPEVTVLKAGLGGCSADFLVKDADGKPVYSANVHVRVRYGVFGVKRADLEVGTNSNGEARIEGLPDKAKPMAYDVQKDGKKASAEQDVMTNCRAKYDLTLK